MEMPEFLRFEPVAVRRQHNGWSVRRQIALIVALARGASVGEAARMLGMTRQSAYRLRGRPDAKSFAAAWDRAVEFARRVEAARFARGAIPDRIETVLVPRYYRGRLVGYVQREDLAGAMRALNMLDRMAERLGAPTTVRAMIDRFAEEARSDRVDEIPPVNGRKMSPPGPSDQAA